MNFDLFNALYFCTTGGFALACGAALLQKRFWGLWFGAMGAAFSLITLVLMVFQARRLPVFGPFEIITQMVFMISVHGLWAQRAYSRQHPDQKHPNRPSPMTTGSWILSLLLLGILSFFPKTVNPDYYMYGQYSVMAFFNFRICAGAFFLMAAIYIGSCNLNNRPANTSYKGRNLLLIGTICFLISECSGSFWCLNWYGDSWHWSRGFLKASSVFMGLMLAFHVPGNWKLSNAARRVMGYLPGLGSLWLLLLH